MFVGIPVIYALFRYKMKNVNFLKLVHELNVLLLLKILWYIWDYLKTFFYLKKINISYFISTCNIKCD